MKDFCDELSLSYIVIPHAHYKEAYVDKKGVTQKGFESSELQFRPWFDKYCIDTNQDKKKDVCIVTSIKTLESATRKKNEGKGYKEDRIFDYGRGNFIVLKQRPRSRRNKASLITMEKMIRAIEGDTRSVARKNHTWIPHDGGWRGHKSLWLPEAEEGQVPEIMKGLLDEDEHYSLLSEVKITHEAQQDIDKLTRLFMNLGRDVNRGIKQNFGWSVRAIAAAAKSYNDVSGSLASRKKAGEQMGRNLYNFVMHHAGLDVFLNPNPYPESLDKRQKFIKNTAPMKRDALMQDVCNSIQANFPPNQQDYMCTLIRDSGIFDRVNEIDIKVIQSNASRRAAHLVSKIAA